MRRWQVRLITDLGTVRDAQGKFHRKGLFLCGYCGDTVERWHYAGNRDQSCGCVRRKLAADRISTHGLYRNKNVHPLAIVWGGMKSRCYSKNHSMYQWYGGRGIRVADEWLHDVDAFVKWSLEHGWAKGLQLDRVDNDGDYSPSNCRYVSGTKNIRNSSATKLTEASVIEIRQRYADGGVSHAELGRLYGVCKSAIGRIVRRQSWADIGG